jgi:hypothetical protein
MTVDTDGRIASLDSPAPGASIRARTPWLLVVARGEARLLAALETIFRDDPRVRVIENRREARALLPRGDAVTRAALPLD